MLHDFHLEKLGNLHSIVEALVPVRPKPHYSIAQASNNMVDLVPYSSFLRSLFQLVAMSELDALLQTSVVMSKVVPSQP